MVFNCGPFFGAESPSKPREASADATESEDEEEAPDSPKDVKENIKSKFLLEMPDDFYHFWDFATSVNSGDPSSEFCSDQWLKC